MLESEIPNEIYFYVKNEYLGMYEDMGIFNVT